MVTRHEPTRKATILSYTVYVPQLAPTDSSVGFSVLVTLLALSYVHRKMLRVRKDVFLDMREDLARRGVQEPPPPDEDEEWEYDYGRGGERV